MPPSQVVDPTQLNLSSDELLLLREGQSALARGAGSSSSRAASRASSQGVFLLNHATLQALEAHFKRVMDHIANQVAYLSEQTQVATQMMYDETGQMIVDADAEIRRFRKINEQIEELDMDFDRIENIHAIVRDIRERIEIAEQELDHSSSHPSSSRHREGHRTGHSGRHRHR
ncbi:hypothetical protein SCUCBS95973_004406 [Sporothrix curviconia]|uniref:Biogenesis of lysosome-related organelles complex 1 subunit CNL1 n=1 Tax=Sporothrix curviconia TaxID=1260050 RepID=A0ABP0BNS1_9PEZI